MQKNLFLGRLLLRFFTVHFHFAVFSRFCFWFCIVCVCVSSVGGSVADCRQILFQVKRMVNFYSWLFRRLAALHLTLPHTAHRTQYSLATPKKRKNERNHGIVFVFVCASASLDVRFFAICFRILLLLFYFYLFIFLFVRLFIIIPLAHSAYRAKRNSESLWLALGVCNTMFTCVCVCVRVYCLLKKKIKSNEIHKSKMGNESNERRRIAGNSTEIFPINLCECVEQTYPFFLLTKRMGKFLPLALCIEMK